jgi:lycopene cyclase domain-containing protein
MPEYTVAAVIAVAITIGLERFVLRTGLLRTSAYWVTMLIVFGFQCLVDGWLTKLDRPIVRYAPGAISGIRFPWDVPIEDFLFGFALLTSVLLLWEWAARRETGHADNTEPDRERASL